MFTQHVPMIIPAFTDRPVSALSCRDHFCIALVAGDGVYGWGSADQGQLGEEGRTHGLIAVLFEAHASSGSRFLSGAGPAMPTTMRDALHAGTCPPSAVDSVACYLARLHTTARSQITNSNRARTEAALFSWPFEARELLDVEKETNLVAAAGELHAIFDTHRQHDAMSKPLAGPRLGCRARTLAGFGWRLPRPSVQLA